MGAQFQAEIAKLSVEHSDHKSDQLLALEAMDVNVRASWLRCRVITAMVKRGCAISSWAVTKRNMVTPSKLHFKTWMPSYRRKFPDEQAYGHGGPTSAP